MHVTNLTDAHTDCKAVEGTVNRILFMLEAGSDEDCHDIRVRLSCRSSSKPRSNESTDDAMLEGALPSIKPHRMPLFVQKAIDPSVKIVMQNGVTLPGGWEPRKDVGTDESHDEATEISPLLVSGESLIFPLDIFRPLDQSSSSDNEANSCLTHYDVIIMYRQLRVGKRSNVSDKSGDQVMVLQNGYIDWISPFTAEFSQTNGPTKPYPCGIQHVSNMVTQSPPPKPSSSAIGTDSIAADGERVPMRCSLVAKGLKSKVAAIILRVTNEVRFDHRYVFFHPR